MSDTSEYPLVDPHAQLTQELVGTQIQVWLLENRQADVRQQLQHYRSQRARLGREYQRLVRTAQPSTE